MSRAVHQLFSHVMHLFTWHFLKKCVASQIFPLSEKEPFAANDVQFLLVRKLGGNAHPFAVYLPGMAPNSVQLLSSGTVSQKWAPDQQTVSHKWLLSSGS